jgi:hypothetical protein
MNKTPEKLYIVFNNTDGIVVTFEPVTSAKADEIISSFPERFAFQGYYLTSSRERIDPKLVKLSKVEYEEVEEDNDSLNELGAF